MSTTTSAPSSPQPPEASPGAAPGSPTATRGARFPLIDALRAMAALSIVAFHTVAISGPPAALWPYVRHLNAGVTIFFVISGVLIYRPFVAARAAGRPSPVLRAYAWRRFLRLVPAYWVALTAFGAIVATRDVFQDHGLYYYGFGQIYSGEVGLGGLGVAWTLCIEVSFYAFVPLWAWGISRWAGSAKAWRWHRELWALAALALVSVAFKALWAMQAASAGSPWANTLPRFFDVFAAGMTIAVLSVHFEGRPLPRWLAPISRFPAVGWVIAAAAYYVSCTFVGNTSPNAPARELLSRYALEAVVAIALVAPAVFGDQGRGVLRRVLRTPALLWLGVVSYGIYLWHPTVLAVLRNHDVHGEYFVLLAVIIAATTAIAAISWYALERPALSLKRYDRTALAQVDVLPLPLRVALGAAGLGMVVIGLRGSDFVILDVFLSVPGALVAVSMLLRGRLRAFRWPVFELAALTAMSAAVAVAVLTLPGNPAGVVPGAMPAQSQVVEVLDGRVLRVYVNGVQAGTSVFPGAVDAGNGPMSIGSFPNDAGWDGRINEVALYGTALSGDEIRRQYAASAGDGPLPSPSAPPGLRAAWHLRPRGDGAVAAVPMRPGERSPRDGGAVFSGSTPPVTVQPPALGAHWTLSVWLQPRANGDRTAVSQLGRLFLKTAVLGTWEAGTFIGANVAGTGTTIVASPHPVFLPYVSPSTTFLAIGLALFITGAGVLWSLRRGRVARWHSM